MAPPSPMSGPRYNEFIQAPKVRVIDENGENLGVMYTREAFEQAQEVGLDLVEISPNADPPVAKFLDSYSWKQPVPGLHKMVIRVPPVTLQPFAESALFDVHSGVDCSAIFEHITEDPNGSLWVVRGGTAVSDGHLCLLARQNDYQCKSVPIAHHKS